MALAAADTAASGRISARQHPATRCLLRCARTTNRPRSVELGAVPAAWGVWTRCPRLSTCPPWRLPTGSQLPSWRICTRAAEPVRATPSSCIFSASRIAAAWTQSAPGHWLPNCPRADPEVAEDPSVSWPIEPHRARSWQRPANLRPGRDRPQRRRGPVVRADPRGHFPATSRPGRRVRPVFGGSAAPTSSGLAQELAADQCGAVPFASTPVRVPHPLVLVVNSARPVRSRAGHAALAVPSPRPRGGWCNPAHLAARGTPAARATSLSSTSIWCCSSPCPSPVYSTSSFGRPRPLPARGAACAGRGGASTRQQVAQHAAVCTHPAGG